MMDSFSFNLFLKIIHLAVVVGIVVFLAHQHQKMVKKKFTIMFALGVLWAVMTGIAQQVLYNQFGQFPWTARLSELIGTLGLILLGIQMSLADELSPIWKVLKYLDSLMDR